MSHQSLIDDAEEAVTKLFSDQSVSQRETRESLEELTGFIDDMLNTLPE